MPGPDLRNHETNMCSPTPGRPQSARSGERSSRDREVTPGVGGAWRVLLICFALLQGAGLSGCTSDPATHAPETPLLIGADFAAPPFYRVEGGDGADLLLLGTVHLGPASGWQFSPAVLSGVARADRLVFEIDLREATEEVVSSLLAETVVLQPPDTLPTVVSPETARLLDELDPQLASMGLPVNARLRLKPWFIAMGLIEGAAHRSGYSSAAAVENALMAELGARPLIQLESYSEQIAMLDDLSPEIQDAMLRDSLLRLDTAHQEVAELVDAWRLGDETELERLSRAGVEEVPELDDLYDVLLEDRNMRWMPTLGSLLDDPKYRGETILVAVGALHLVGEDGLVDLLREAGYPVGRVDHFRSLDAEDGDEGP